MGPMYRMRLAILAALAGWLSVTSPALALDKANVKFATRFGAVERLATERGLTVGKASLTELDALWDEVKELE